MIPTNCHSAKLAHFVRYAELWAELEREYGYLSVRIWNDRVAPELSRKSADRQFHRVILYLASKGHAVTREWRGPEGRAGAPWIAYRAVKPAPVLGRCELCGFEGVEGESVKSYPLGLGPHCLGVYRLCTDRYKPGHTPVRIAKWLVGRWHLELGV